MVNANKARLVAAGAVALLEAVSINASFDDTTREWAQDALNTLK
jgi:hypothetical protein